MYTTGYRSLVVNAGMRSNLSHRVSMPGREEKLAALKRTLQTRVESFVGTVVALHGKAEVVDPLCTEPRSAEAGQRLARGMKVHVKEGRALVRMNDGSDLWLAAGAVLDLSPWCEAARSLRLAAGRMLALVAREVARPFTTETALGAICVTGTAFEAAATGDALCVAVLHGSVNLQTSRGTARVVRGRMADVSRDGAARVSRLQTLPTWMGDLADSAGNDRVRPAFAAVESATGVKSFGVSRRWVSVFGAVLGVGLLVGLVAGGKRFSPVAGGSASQNELTVTKPGAADSESTKRVSRPGRRIDINGQVFDLETVSKAELDAAIAKLSPTEQQRTRELLAAFDFGGDGVSVTTQPSTGRPRVQVGAPDDMMGQIISRELNSSIDVYRDLVKSGMSQAQAEQVIEKSLGDSLQKQLPEQFGGDTQVKVDIKTDEGESKPNSAELKVGFYIVDEDPIAGASDDVVEEAVQDEEQTTDETQFPLTEEELPRFDDDGALPSEPPAEVDPAIEDGTRRGM